MCARAAEIGLREIAFADHVDNNPRDLSFGRFRYDAVATGINEARQRFNGRLNILIGAELAEPHEYPTEISNLISAGRFDLLIGSVHWVSGELISAPNFDFSRMAELYDAYFETVLRMVETADFDVLAHIDIVKRYGVMRLGPFRAEPFYNRIAHILRVIIERQIALEVNTSGLRQPCKELFPSLEILRLYRDMGGEMVTVGSDAHRVEHVGFGLDQAVSVLRDLGFKGLTTFRDRVPKIIEW